MKLIPERLRIARLKKELTLNQVERLTKGAIKTSTLSFYERGLSSPTYNKVRLLAKLYEVSPSYFEENFKKEDLPLAPKQLEILLSLILEKIKLTSNEKKTVRKVFQKFKREIAKNLS